MRSMTVALPRFLAILSVLILMSNLKIVEAQTAMPSFRVDTDIYVDMKQPPVKRTITLFANGVYYDFGSDSEGMTTIIDTTLQKIVLLDANRKLKTEVSLASLQAEIDQAASQTPDSMKSISIEQWSESDAEGRTLTVGNEEMTYAATVLQPPTPGVAEQFAEFADWSARLNAAFPPKLPPYLRLRLNRALAEQGVVPKKITRTVRQNTIYANTSATWQLSSDDQKRIQNALDSSAKFTAVPATNFWSKP